MVRPRDDDRGAAESEQTNDLEDFTLGTQKVKPGQSAPVVSRGNRRIENLLRVYSELEFDHPDFRRPGARGGRGDVPFHADGSSIGCYT